MYVLKYMEGTGVWEGIWHAGACVILLICLYIKCLRLILGVTCSSYIGDDLCTLEKCLF
jgi:hypothetical protein